MKDNLDFNHLKIFLAVVERHGFGAAARQLGISQPSVSQQIRRLEDRVGHKLFTRDGGITLTSEGEALVIFARAMLAIADQVRAYFQQPKVKGSLRVGLNEDFARTALPAVLNIFTRTYPDLELLIDCNLSSYELFSDLDKGRLDLVVAKLPETKVRGEVIWRERLLWVGCRRDMRFDEGAVPLVASSMPGVTRDVVLQTLADAGRTWRIRFRSPSLSALEAAVCAGLCVGALMRGVSTGNAVVLDEGCGLPPLPNVAFCLDTRGSAKPAVVAFAALLRETVLQLIRTGPPAGLEPEAD